VNPTKQLVSAEASKQMNCLEGGEDNVYLTQVEQTEKDCFIKKDKKTGSTFVTCVTSKEDLVVVFHHDMLAKDCLIVKPEELKLEELVTMNEECCQNVAPELIGIQGIDMVT